MDPLLADLRFAVRNILRRPGFAALAVLTLAVGIGVNTVAFSAVNALLFHPFVFKGVDRLGWIMLATPGNPHGELSRREFDMVSRQARSFDGLAVEGRLPLALQVDGRAEQLWTLLVSSGYFRALDTRPEAGRVLDAADATRDDLVAVVSHRFFEQRLGGGSLAGRTLTIANRTVSIVGVLGDDFQGPGGVYAPDVWLPLERAAALGVPQRLIDGDDRWLTAIGRLAAGAGDAQAGAELAAMASTLPVPRDASSKDRRLQFHPMRDGHPEVRGLARFVWIAMAVVGTVLLIACFNVAALLLARAAERRREIGIRTALGASRARIVRQLVVEGLVLAGVSGAAALVLAAWSGPLLAFFSLPAPIPQRMHLGVDGRLVAFTAAMVVIAGVLPGLLPALQATRRDIFLSMRLDAAAGGGRPSRSRNRFVVAQIAGSTLFLATALLFVRSFLNANAFDPGFDVERTIVAQMDPASFGLDGPRTMAFARELAARLSDRPGTIAAVANRAPFHVGYPIAETVSTSALDCATASCKPTVVYSVSRRHFEALGVPLRAGRDFTQEEIDRGRAVIVSESLAASLWPGRSPLGETVRLGKAGAFALVVGVVGETKHLAIENRVDPAVYRPIGDADVAHGFTLIVRTEGPAAPAIAAIRDTVHALAPSLPIAALSTMKQRLELPLWPRRTAAGFFLVCGSLALLLATVGLFGVTYFAVRQRTREFGVRIALGARSGDVMRQVLGEGVRLAMPGAAAGLVLAAIAARVLSRMLLGVSPADPASFAATAAIELAVALAACALPARRATQADPLVALRDE